MSALADLRVLDLTRVLGGPYCTMLLADLGADVVKIEQPGGDIVRSTPPFAESDDEPYGGYFQSVNRGKRSLELDFRDEGDRAAFLDLAAAADVVVENYRAGTMEKFGLEYERLRETNPGLVYATIRGFGDPRTGETDRQGQPAFDLVAQALGGVMQLNGQDDSPPTKVGLGIGDLFTGVLNAVGILAALHYRERTGRGQFVDTAMYDCMISLCERAVYQYSYTGEIPRRRGNSHPTLFPYDAFETTDGFVVVAAIGNNHWKALCAAMDRPDLAADYPTPTDRLDDRDRLRAEIAAWTRERPTDDLLDALDGDVPCAPVQDVADVFADDHARDREMLVEVPQPGTDRSVTIAGTPIKLTETPPEPGGRAPLLDEHREEMLGDPSRADSPDGESPRESGTSARWAPVPDGGDASSLSAPAVFDALGASGRRHALLALRDLGGDATLETLAADAAARRDGAAPDAVSAERRARAAAALHGEHLPALVEAGVVEYDPDEGRVALTDAAGDLDPYFELLDAG